MKKISYRSRKPSSKEPIRNADIPSSNSGEEGLSGEPEAGVGRGLSLPGEPTAAYDEAGERDFVVPPKFRRSKNVDSKKLLDLFVMLGDEMDSEGEFVMANFADFMINKIAEQKSLDYSELFKNLLIKIVESDVLDKNTLITTLVSVFNRVLSLSVNSGLELGESKLEAYQAAVSRAEEYVK